jgi:hypothetical protein
MKITPAYVFIHNVHLAVYLDIESGFKISAKFQLNFGNFGSGQKKNPKFCNTLIHVLYNAKLIFSIVYIAYSSIQ